MNPEIFRLSPSTACAEAMGDILALGITAAPVVDANGVPIGIVSLRDLIGPGGDRVEERMNAPVTTIGVGVAIDEAARVLVENGRHRLVCIDAEGRAVGVVSAVDVLAAVQGLPVRHPNGFPHIDHVTGLSFTDEAPLDADHVEIAPDGPGLILLVHGGAGERETPIWAEASPNVRTRLYELSRSPKRTRSSRACSTWAPQPCASARRRSPGAGEGRRPYTS